MRRCLPVSVIGLSVLLAGCKSEPGPDTSDTQETAIEVPPGFELSPIQSCETKEKLSFDRFENVGSSRGFTKAINPNLSSTPGVIHTGLVAEDYDNDGDIDISFNRPDQMPILYVNDGTGHFTEVLQDFIPEIITAGRVFITHGAADMNGDSLPDLVFTGSGLIAVSENLGDLKFGQPESWIYFSTLPYPTFQSFHLGDVDADDDLDILLAGTAIITGANQGETTEASPELLYLNTGEGFELEATLQHPEGAGFSLLSLITDYDNDGDQDLQTFTDLGRRTPTNFYRNDGLNSDDSLTLVEESSAIGTNLRMSAMGVTTGDYNRDGRFDYCISDIGPVKCLMSTGNGSFVESGVAMGLEPELMLNWDSWSGWSIEVEDLDNDGIEDAVNAAGLDMRGDLPEEQPDAIWKGVEPGLFEDWSVRTGFADVETHYALATADFDGDGFLDILTIGAETQPQLWMNQCDNQAWVQLELEGSGLNKGAFGVRVSVKAGGQTQLREVQNLRALAQAPSRVHFGLGEAEVIEELTLQWPDGSVDTLTNVKPNRLIHFRVEDRQ